MTRLVAILGGLAAAAGAAAADPLDLAAGHALFERLWVAAPASTGAADGLGPLFNARSCNGCHEGGGAARVFERDGATVARGLVMRLAGADGGPHPLFGVQLQDRAVAGLLPEGRISVRLDGRALTVSADYSGASTEAVFGEVRIAPSLRGRGMLERIDDAAIAALADPGDSDGDGISGRMRRVDDGAGATAAGRFGHKASSPSLVTQTAAAAAIDLGLSSRQHPLPYGDCTTSQVLCRKAAGSDAAELSSAAIGLIAAYVGALAVKAPVAAPADLALFRSAGCAACHRPDMPDQAGRRWPVFTDLLLHDLGPDAAGSLGEGGFSPSEWRTAPLLDLDPLDGQRRFLHDGRAASLHDAIMFHGGEAGPARSAYGALTEADRQRLVAFIAGL